MSNPEETSPAASQPEPKPRGPRSRKRRWFFVASGLGLAALTGLFATRAWAHGWHHGRFGRPQTAADMRERLGRGADFALSRVDATDDQRKRVDAILVQSAPQLFAVMERGGKLRKEVVDAVASGNHAAAETARKQGLAWADEASRLWLSTIEQSMAVLDGPQREKVREHLKRFGDHGPEGHHGHGPHGPRGQAGSGSAH